LIDNIRPIGYQAAACDKGTFKVYSGQLVPGRKVHDQIAM
jgi:hypothetical protein